MMRARVPRLRLLRAAMTTAADGLRSYPTTAGLVAATLFLSLVAIVPLTELFGWREGALRSRLLLLPLHSGDLGLDWRMGVTSPAAIRQEAAATLGALLFAVAVGIVVVGATTLIVICVAREAARRDDLLVRRAVGASRRVLCGAAVIEGGAIALAPLLAGAGLGVVIARMAVSSWPGTMQPVVSTASTVAVLVLLAVALAGMLYPVLLPRRRVPDVEAHRPLSIAPAAFQLAACFAVLTTSALVARHAAALMPQDSAESGDGVVLAVSVPSGPRAVRAAGYRDLLDSLRRAGLDSVSLTGPGVLTGYGHVALVTTHCGYCSEAGLLMPWRIKPAAHQIVSADTFRLLDLSLIAGRGIDAGDDWTAPRVAVVSRSLALREFQDGDPIGRRIRVGDDEADGSVVVGVVEDRMPTGLGGSLQPRYAVYLSVLQHPPDAVDLLVRDAGGAEVDDTLRRAVATALPGADVGRETLSESALRRAQAAPVAWFGRWFGAAGWAMVGLAAIGIFVFMRLWVRSLAGELGVRRSVGARRSHVARLVLVRAAGVGVAGLGVGAWLGAAIWSVLPAALTGAVVWEPGVMGPYALLLAGTAVLGAVLPIWRAAEATPVALLGAHDG